MPRRAGHILAVVMLLAAFLEPVRIIPAVHARSDPPLTVQSVQPIEHLPVVPRSQLSTRSPLPTPVPLDPNATPLPAPTVTPVLRPPSLVWPVAGTVTQWYSSGHPAIDIAAPCGTPVVAPASGTIVYAGWKTNGGGYVVDIDTGWSLVSLNHLSGFAVTSGPVAQGQVVAYVGATGWASGCHVHAGLLVNGAWVDPLGFLN